MRLIFGRAFMKVRSLTLPSFVENRYIHRSVEKQMAVSDGFSP